MAILARPKDNEDYARLVGMTQPSATPSKRIGTEAPVGSVATGPSAGKTAAEFTQATKSSPGNVFARQLSGANISGITNLAEKPLLREAGEESLRVAGEGNTYTNTQKTNLANQPQFTDFSAAAGGVASGDEKTTTTGQAILNRTSIPVPKLDIGDIREFTPNQALRGGTVESLLKKESKGPYTSGMAGLDALLFGKKGGAADLANSGIALRATGQAAADALEKSATTDAETNAANLVSSQKSGLMTAIQGGLTAREDAYTKAPDGQKSKLQMAQEKLMNEYAQKYGDVTKQRQTAITKQMNALQNQALENTINKLRQESITNQEKRGQGTQGDNTVKIPLRAELLAQAQSDPRYLNVVQRLQLQAPYAQQRGLMQAGQVPTLGLQNVIAQEDADQYNRLQQLIGGKAVQPITAAFEAPTYDSDDLQRFFESLRPQTNL